MSCKTAAISNIVCFFSERCSASPIVLAKPYTFSAWLTKFHPPFPKPASAEPGLPSSKTLVFTNPCSRLSRVLETAERLFLPSCAIPAGRVNRRACRQAFTTPTAAPSRLSFFTSSPGRRTRPTARLQARHSWACRRDQASHRRYSARRSPTSPQKAQHR